MVGRLVVPRLVEPAPHVRLDVPDAADPDVAQRELHEHRARGLFRDDRGRPDYLRDDAFVLRLGDEFRCDARNGLFAELRIVFGTDCIG